LGRYCITIGCPRCHGCTKKYGHRHGRQRYRCLTCGYVFRRQKTKLPVSLRDFNAFRDYALKAVNQEALTKRLKLSRQELSTRFNWFLTLPPAPELINRVVLPQAAATVQPWVYGFDGKWLGRNLVLLVHRDVIHKETLWWSVATSENMVAVYRDLIALAGSGIARPKGAVTDGKPGIASVIKSIFHLDFCQRCLVHVERDLKNYLPQNSPIEATQRLRIVCLGMTEIKSLSDRDCYLSMLDRWYRRYASLLKERSYPEPGSTAKRHWWYTHGNLRRAWRLLTKDQNSLFHFLDNPLVPSTNNSLEGVNRHLRRREGMGKGKQLALMMWRLAFSRIKTDRQRLKLWAYWKRTFF